MRFSPDRTRYRSRHQVGNMSIQAEWRQGLAGLRVGAFWEPGDPALLDGYRGSDYSPAHSGYAIPKPPTGSAQPTAPLPHAPSPPATLEICDRVVLMQHGEITFESQAAATSAEELLEIVRREYRAVRTG